MKRRTDNRAALKRAFLVRLTHCCNSSGQRQPSIGLMASMARADSSVREIDPGFLIGLLQLLGGTPPYAIWCTGFGQPCQHGAGRLVMNVPSEPSHAHPICLGVVVDRKRWATQQRLNALNAPSERKHEQHALAAAAERKPSCYFLV